MDITRAITHGTDPVGRGVGPVLEPRDVLAILEGSGPESRRLKSIRLAEMLLDHCGVDASATDVLDSGRALDRFQRIVAAQNGDPDVDSDDLQPGPESTIGRAERARIATRVDNR